MRFALREEIKTKTFFSGVEKKKSYGEKEENYMDQKM